METPIEEVQHELPPPEENTTSPEEQAALEEIMTPEPVVEEPTEPFVPVVEEPTEPFVPVVEEPTEPVVPVVEEPVVPVVEEPVVPVVEEPVVPVVEEPVVPVVDVVSEEDKKIATMTQQAEDLKAALQKARANKQIASSEATPMMSQKKQTEKAVDERRRRVLLGRHAEKTIMTDNGTLIVEEGAEVTEEVLQRARLSNKIIELSMHVK